MGSIIFGTYNAESTGRCPLSIGTLTLNHDADSARTFDYFDC
jgi:hypothetical protein